MPALLSYLIAVTLLLGGGYGALNWLATPEPVKVAAKTAPKPSPPHYTDNSKPDSTNAQSPQVTPPEPGKPEFSGNDQAKVTANGKAVDGKAVGSDPPPAASSPQPEPPVAASQQKRWFRSRIARRKPGCPRPQATREASSSTLKRHPQKPSRTIGLRPDTKSKSNRSPP
jgi:hypothetical protein